MTTDGANSDKRINGLNSQHRPWSSWLIGYIVSFIIILVGSLILVSFARTLIKPIDGIFMAEHAQACNLHESPCGATDFAPVTFPHSDRAPTDFSSRNWVYHINFENQGSLRQAIYFPQFSETLSLSINGHILDDMPDFESRQSRRWSRPEYYLIPDEFLVPGQNLIEINLSGYKILGTDMFPIFIGSADILKPHYDLRFWSTAGVAWLNLVLVVISTFWLLGIWSKRRRDNIFLWLMMSNVFVFIISVCFLFDTLGFSFEMRIKLMVLSAYGFAYGVLKFYSKYVGKSSGKLDKAFEIFIIAGVILNTLVPFFDSKTSLTFSIIIGTALGFLVPAMVWAYRDQVSRGTFNVMFYGYCLTAIGFIHSGVFFIMLSRVTSFTVLPYFTASYLFTVLWLIWTQFLDALDTSETLTTTLQTRIEDKARELEHTYQALAESQRRQTLDHERQRIMMDLHDGIGGHLVNTIAYMDNSEIKDPTLKTALESALRDLSFMIDSLENTDSIATLLGMYRSRMEPLLASHGIEFIWKVGDDPQMPKPGPSGNLNLLRIIQEAVTNSIKHAQATEITVQTDHRSVRISDNGTGFETDKAGDRTKRAGGVGLVSMRKRAEAINADFDLKSDMTGTDIILSWIKD